MCTSVSPIQNLKGYNDNTRELLSQASDLLCRQGSPNPGRIFKNDIKNNKDDNNSSRSQAPIPTRPHSIISPSLETEHTLALARPIQPRKT